MFAAPVIAQLVERETVVGCYTVISRSAVRLRLAGGVIILLKIIEVQHVHSAVCCSHVTVDVNPGNLTGLSRE